jgi:hypothetical protein
MTRSSDAPEWLKELPALISSQGGVIFNNKHIEYWKERAHEAERKLRERDATISRQREALEMAEGAVVMLRTALRHDDTKDELVFRCDDILRDLRKSTPTPPEHGKDKG